MINVVLDLRAPEVAYQQDGYLDPALVPATGLPVTVTYGGMAQGQEVQVIMAAPNGAEHALAAQTVAFGQTALEFEVPKSVMDEYHEKILVIYYAVSLVAGGLKQSSRVVAFRYEAADRVVDYTKFGPVDYLNGWVPTTSSTLMFRYYPDNVIPKAGFFSAANSQYPTLSKRLALPAGNYQIVAFMWGSTQIGGNISVTNHQPHSFSIRGWEAVSVPFVSAGQPLDIVIAIGLGNGFEFDFSVISIKRLD